MPPIPNPKLVVVGILAIAFLALGLSNCHYRTQAAQLRTERDEARGKLDTCQAGNAEQSAVISNLQAENNRWAEACAVKESLKAAAGNAEAYRAKIRSLSTELDRREAADHALPDCEKLLATDLTSLCPATALSVRDRAALYRAGENSRSEGSDRPANP